jgi:hypothetical protein
MTFRCSAAAAFLGVAGDELLIPIEREPPEGGHRV